MRISKTTPHLATYFFSVSMLITWVIMQTPGLPVTAAYSSKQRTVNTSTHGLLPLTQDGSQGAQASTKEQITARLNELDGLIGSLKVELANNSTDTTLLAQLKAAIDEYDLLSYSLGGDQASPSPVGNSASKNEVELQLGLIPVPQGCTGASATFTQSVATTIPSGPAVVTSTLVVAGADPFLFDVNATTFITHTFPADLDITLTSPAGTVVTLTTDNGAGNDNVFNGTIWDDDANPLGQVPYVTNNGVATDHTYANLTLASPLVPEEAMGAFIGENPNGIWTITISDDTSGDRGSLARWSLDLVTLPAAPTQMATSFTQSVATTIPSGPAVVTSTLVVAGADPFLFDVNATTFITHTFPADLDITLTSPAGTVVTLTTDNGAGNDNVFNGTIWDDDANPLGQVPYVTNNGVATDHTYANLTLASPLVPEEAMGAFIGENPNGIWTITISNDTAGNLGSLDGWTLNITTATCAAAAPTCVITCPANVTQSNDAGLCGALVTYPVPETSGTCGTVTCSPASGSFFPAGTTTVTCSISTPPGGAGCTFNVTVTDDEAPSITCPANITVSNDTNQCGAVVNYPAPTVTDNCPGSFTATCSPASGSFFPAGTTTVTCSISTPPGGAGCTFTVTVNDTQMPTIICAANATVSNDPNRCGAVFNYPPPTVSDNCPKVGTPICSPLSGSTFPKGTTTVTCSVSDAASNSAGCTFTVTVNDTQPPSISCPANVASVTDACGGTTTVFSYAPPSATDNCPDVTTVCVPPSGSVLTTGVTTITCTATDTSGNTASCSFTVSVFDAFIQDDDNPAKVLLWNTQTGAYRFCCDGRIYTGTGLVINNGSMHSIRHVPTERRIHGGLNCSTGKGEGGLKANECTIIDRDITNNTGACGMTVNSASR